jgi:hypothetical protein
VKKRGWRLSETKKIRADSGKVGTTLGSNDTALAQGRVEELEVGLLEEAFGGTLRVRAVGDDNIELVLVLLEELEAVTNVGVGVRVLEANGHAREVLLGETDDSLIDVAKGSLLDGGVLDNLTEDTTVTAADDKDLLRVGVGVQGEVGNHLLVGELIALGALDGAVKDEDGTVVAALEDKNILVLGLLVVKDLVDLKAHSLARPHVGLLGEPSICISPLSALFAICGHRGVMEGGYNKHTDDGGVGKLAHDE